MTQAAPASRESGLPNTDYYAPDYLLEVEGQELDPVSKGDVLDLKVTLSLRDIAGFELTLNNWDDRRFTFKYSDTDAFDLGKEVHVRLGYADRLVSVFRGIVTRISPKFPESGPPTISITCADNLIRLKNRHPPEGESKRYENMSDWQIAEEIANRNRLGFEATREGPVHDIVWQQNLDDASFLMQRAARIDFDCHIRTDSETGEAVLHFVRPTDGRSGSSERVYVFDWGKSLSNFTPELATADQVGSVTVRGWDPMRREVIEYTATGEDLTGEAPQTDRSGPNASAETSERTEEVVDAPVRSEEEARHLAVSLLQERAYNFFTGTANVIGIADLEPGQNVELGGLGERFSGRYHVETVEHTLGEGGFLTSFSVRRIYDGPVRSAEGSGT